ncbi:MAG: alpha/beta hydrolase [Steroidobacteraceae bacterium]|jgi:pimeloyl-ACP methyl ester carboxylesterase|nr:alpha/beta hydrolase [Steroidobacteraceae bacterium]
MLGAALVLLLSAAAVIRLLAARDTAARVAELELRHRFAPTRHGAIEYVAWGEGDTAVLVLHGAGGGFDQGRLIAEAFVGAGAGADWRAEAGAAGLRWIAPSRFGYLGSKLPEGDASPVAQADALADLMDHLRIDRLAVVGFSGGTPPALQLAARHPRRVSALVLVSSAPFTPYAPDESARPVPAPVYQALLGSDVVYGVLARVARELLLEAFDARAELRAGLPAGERAFVERLVDGFVPASGRIAGVRNEGAAIDPRIDYALETIRAPTLVVHARDDRLNAFALGETLARRIPSAGFLALDRGGHLLLGSHAQVRARVIEHVTAPP